MKPIPRFFMLMMTGVLIIAISSFPHVTSSIEETTSDIEISSIEKEPGGFMVTFTNSGDTYLRAVQFNISVTGGWILPVDFHYDEQLYDCNCTDVMEPGATLQISTNNHESFVSFGFLDVIVDVTSSATGPRHAEQQAFIIGSFIILL